MLLLVTPILETAVNDKLHIFGVHVSPKFRHDANEHTAKSKNEFATQEIRPSEEHLNSAELLILGDDRS